jgi:hypothetical protein
MNYREKRLLELMNNMPQQAGEEGDYDAVIPVVEFDFSENPDPDKARKKNIKQAIKALKPTKRWYTLPGTGFLPMVGSGLRFKYSSSHQCCIDGSDCRRQDYGDLWPEYMVDKYTGNINPFRPWSGVLYGRGVQIGSTYCPQHLQLYHLLLQWVQQEEHSHDKGFFKRMKKKGVAFVPVVKKKSNEPEHPLIAKWGPVFEEAKRDGIEVMHRKDPITGENDITMLIFDNRVLKVKKAQGTTLENDYVVGPPDTTEAEVENDEQ